MYVKSPPSSLSREPVVVINRKGEQISINTWDYMAWLIRIRKDEYVPHHDDRYPGIVYVRPVQTHTPGVKTKGFDVSVIEWERFRRMVLLGRWDLKRRTVRFRRRKWQR